MIQAAIDATPIGGVCDLGGETHTVPHGAQFVVPHSMTITNGTIIVDSDRVPERHLFELSALTGPDAHRVEFRDITITGPTTTGWDAGTENPYGAIGWVYYRTWASTLIIDGCTITGGYGSGILRNGGGRVDITNSHLEGWVDAIAFFEGHGGHGTILVRDTTLQAPANSKYDSIGAYIHPHLHVTMERVEANGWHRFALYLNGNPQSAGNHDLIDVTATDCALIQTGSSSTTTLVRCAELGMVSNGGSLLKGPVLSIESLWGSTGTIGLLSGVAHARRFVGDVFCGPGYWVACGANTTGTVTFTDCTLILGAKSSAIQVTNRSTVAATFAACTVTGTPRWVVNLEGGTVRFVNMPTPSPVRVVSPGVML